MRIGTETVYQEVYRRVHRGRNGKVKEGETDLRPLLPRRHTRRAKKGFRKAQREERASVLPSTEKRLKIASHRQRLRVFFAHPYCSHEREHEWSHTTILPKEDELG